jgi:DNA-3-methyladenine glycosylase I
MTQLIQRCQWVPLGDPLYVSYHDEEWGVPVHDDRKLFEMLTLEGAQAGLSWATILKRREGYLRGFDGFDPRKVAAYDDEKVAALLNDEGIIRNRMKVLSAVNNARAVLRVQQEFGSLESYIWQFVGGAPRVNCPGTLADIPAETPESRAMSKDLKRRGFSFVGPTVCYAFMQACGLVDDHTLDCFKARCGRD